MSGRKFDHLELQVARTIERSVLERDRFTVTNAFIVHRRTGGHGNRAGETGVHLDRDILLHPAGHKGLHRVFPLVQPGPAQDEVDHAKMIANPGHRHHRLPAPGGGQAVHRIFQLGPHHRGDVKHVFRREFERSQARAWQRSLEALLKKPALIVRLHVGEGVAVFVVIDPGEIHFRLRLQCAGRAQHPGGLDFHHMLLRRLNCAGLQILAPGTANQVGLVTVIGRQQIAGVFVSRVHQHVFALAQFHTDDGMVEKGIGHVLVHFRADIDEHRIGGQPGGAEQRNEQGGLVPADAVLFGVSDFDIMRFEAGPVRFRGQSHVTNVLGHVIKHRLDFLHVRLGPGDQFIDLVGHVCRGGFEMGEAQVPVPFGDGLPIGRGADDHALQDIFPGRHGGFWEHAGYVVDFPLLHNGVVRARIGAVADGSVDFIAQCNAHQRPVGRRMDFIGDVADVTLVFKNVFLRVLPRHERARDGLAGDGMDHVADFQLGKVHLQNFAVRIVNVHRHLAVINRFLGIGRDIDRRHRAVRADALELDDFFGGVGDHEGEGKRAIVALALFRQHLDEGLVLAFAGAVRPVNPHQILLYCGLIAIRVFFQRDFRRGGHDLFGI